MQEITELLAITQKLKEKYQRAFSLDGKLVGDIGEVLAAQKFDIELLPEQTKTYDAVENVSGRKIQIKASFKDNYYFPNELKMPDYILYISIKEDGSIETRYNGTGRFLYESLILNKIKGDSTGYMLNTRKLMELDNKVNPMHRIKERT